jgi:thiol-disulfide isomerase/thioredoxin
MFPNGNLNRSFVLLILLIFGLSITPSFAGGQATLEEAYPDLGFGVLRYATLADLPKGTVLKSDDIVIDESQLLQTVGKESPEFREELKKNLIFVLEQEVENKLLIAEVYKNGYPKEILEDQTISRFKNSKIPALSVSDEDTKAFYEKNSAALGNLPFEQVAEGVKEYLLDKKREEAHKAYLLDLASSKNIQIQSSWAKENCARARDNPVDQARSSGKPTLVEFGATGCTGCDMMQPILSDLEKRFFGKVNIVFVHVHHFRFLAARYRINLIPVQAFFDKTGKEVFRHVGFYPQNEVETKLAEMGVN